MSGGGNFSQFQGDRSSTQGQGGAGYSAPPASNPYQSAFNSQQGSQQRATSPLIQQQMMRQQQPMFDPMQPQGTGIEAAIMQMLSSQNQPMMRPQMQQMPQYRSPALGFRPDMAQAQQSLNRVQPSVQKQEQEAQAARIAELEAQLASYNPPNDYSTG